ncbi:MAG: outer membrane beta-barrel protein, partial [Deltaproteobacteria bacterium]|nr:outer membrane beta-barrel protein [Deltaproteobacteria bacterium]
AVSGVSKANAPEAAPLQEQRVGSAAAAPAPIAGQQPSNPQMGAAAPVTITGAPADASSASGVSVAQVAPADDKADEGTRISVQPRFGTSSVTNSIYDVSAKFATGFSLGVDLSDYITIEGGYTYASYSLGAGNSISYSPGFNTQSYLQTVNLNDNMIDAGVKAYIMGPKSRIRPFVGGGLGYRKGYVNYDDRTQSYLKQFNQYAAQDVEISGFAGYVETGIEFKVTKSISLTGTFKYFNMLSSKQSNPLDPNAFLNQNGYGYYGYNGGLAPGYYGGGLSGTTAAGGYGYNNDTRSQASNALAQNNFYQLMAGIQISF